MANQVAHDKMCTLWEEVADTTGMRMTLSKDLEIYNMSDTANKDRTGNASDTNFSSTGTQGDREYIPQDYRFIVNSGITTTAGNAQDIIDRMIPVNRNRSHNILAQISAKELQDPQRVSKVASGFAREIANKIDLTCYETMINQSTMCITDTGAFDFNLGIAAEVLMLNRGLSAFDRKLFMSNKHYASVAKELGLASRETFVKDAISRARIPDLATFQTMRSDYLINVAGATATGGTVTAESSHTVATYDTDGFYLDNRSQTLGVTGLTAAEFPVGTKFTIAGVNAVHPETREDTGELMTFTVIKANASNPTIQPAIVPTGPYQNVTAAAGASAAITILNKATDAPSLFYTPESTVLIPGNVPVIDGAGVQTQTLTTEQGIPMTMVYWYDGHTMKYNIKAVFNFDVQVIYPDMLGGIYANQA